VKISSEHRCLVTGTTSGLGFELSLALARVGAEVIMHGRSQAGVAEAADKVRAMVPGARLLTVHADFGVEAGARALVEQLPEGQIDLVINNAGAEFANYGLNADGVERTVGVNHFSPLLLTELLLPRVAADGVLATISSSSTDYISVDPTQYDIAGHFLEEGYTQLRAYGISKLFNLCALNALGRSRTVGPAIILCDPGGIQTSFAEKAGEKAFLDMTITHWEDCVTAEEACRQTLAAIGRDDLQSGGLYYNGAPRDMPASFRDEAFADEVYAASSALLARG